MLKKNTSYTFPLLTAWPINTATTCLKKKKNNLAEMWTFDMY